MPEQASLSGMANDMPYRLQKDEPVAGGLKRIAEEVISGAIKQLQSADDLSRSIYAVRKDIKKLRAILRLLEPRLGPIYVEENRRLRDLARRFSALRDLDVSLELLATFAKQYKRQSTLAPYRKALTEKQSALKLQIHWQTELAQCMDALGGTCKRIEDWPLHGLTRAFLDSQIQKTQKQSRHAFLQAKRSPTPEDFHELRKSVKRELNQRRLVDADEAPLRDLKELARLLGDHHNLAVFLSTLENPSQRFRSMARRDLKRYEPQILPLGARLYEDHQQPAAA
jgi:CHAD domain-containing protein